MKRFLINILLFIPGLIVTYIALLFVFAGTVSVSWRSNLYYKHGGVGHTYTRLREADTITNLDVLVLGTSHVYHGYDPSFFQQKGIRLFDLASPLQAVTMTEYLVNKYIDRMNPKYVIFDLYPDSFNGHTFESAVDVFSNSPIDINLVKQAFKLNDIKVYNTLIYSATRQILQLDKGFKEPIIEGYDTYKKGGYEASFRTYQGDSTYHKNRHLINATQVSAFKSILLILKKRNIPFVLVQSPVLNGKYISYTNNDAIDAIFSKSGKYYNFNKTLNMPDSLLWDYNHLNTKGALFYDNRLIDKLTEDPFFKRLLNKKAIIKSK